jgi:hypothetical protein
VVATGYVRLTHLGLPQIFERLLKNQTIRLFERPLKQTNILLIPNRPNASWPFVHLCPDHPQ